MTVAAKGAKKAPESAAAPWQARHFALRVSGKIAWVTLNRPERKNPLTFESYAELRDFFRHLAAMDAIKCVILGGAGGNFSSGGDVHDIIGPLVRMKMPALLAFTRMTGDLVYAIRRCPQTVIAAIDGICAGAGACLALASDLRLGTPRSKVAFLFARVGLAGCDMGATAMLPRVIGQGRAAELLFTGRAMAGEEALAWGFYNKLVEPEALAAEAEALARMLADGPTFAHAMTKRMLDQEWTRGLAEALEEEAEAQAICMETEDFRRAYEAFVKKTKPVFEGN